MVSVFEAIILGIVQGITEWLPISSSGHLVLMQNLMNTDVPVVFDVVLHFGSLFVILLVFWKRIIALIKGLLKKDKKSINLVLMLLFASIPIAVIGVFLNDLIKSIFNNNLTVGISLLITSALLFLSRFPKNKTKKLDFKNTFLIGIAQALAILPGVSRSGATISAGLIQSVKREDAAEFSFLLAIPAIIGATVFEMKNLSQISNFTPLIISTLTTIIAGYFSLRLLLRIIKEKKFSWFSLYCLILGIIIITAH
ncbi:undecaprenyl-diphosphatase UppP [Candidatus Woesearchaeota archaeon]|nr:undecaprenyl-diphosphatase UppP [Candidatus Woesearchaeota archaeon]